MFGYCIFASSRQTAAGEAETFMNDKLGIARPWLFRAIRGLEIMGLLALLSGLASSRWAVAGAGGAMIVTSYGIFRRRFPIVEQKDRGCMNMSDRD
jgi:hypothetical protein